MADTYTPNLNLKKPGYESFADIDDINGNMDKIDEAYKRLDEKSPVVDTTLTKSGQAADAKATGEALSSLKNDLVDLQTKTRINYLRPILQTQTVNGVTITNNGDGTYTVNGTASNTFEVRLADDVRNLKDKYYSCLTKETINDFYMSLWYSGSGLYRVDNETQITITNQTVLSPYLHFNSGATFNNVVIKPMLTDDLSATYDDFVSGFDCFTPDTKMDLLWTNASPTSAFPTQNISLDFNNYTYAICIFREYGIDNNNYISCILKKGFKFDVFIAGIRNLIRWVQFTSEGFSIEGAYIYTIYNGESGAYQDDLALIPYQIYGVK